MNMYREGQPWFVAILTQAVVVALWMKAVPHSGRIASPDLGHKTVLTVCLFPSSRQESSLNFVNFFDRPWGKIHCHS